MKLLPLVAGIVLLSLSLVVITSLVWLALIEFDLIPFVKGRKAMERSIYEQREMVQMINKPGGTWKAQINPSAMLHNVYSRSVEDEVKQNLEVWKSTLMRLDIMNVYSMEHHYGKPDSSKIPEYFDAREEWSHCDSIREPNIEQGACGSCWVVTGAAVISDRICVHSKGRLNVRISSDDILNCNPQGSGCEGGELYEPFAFWVDKGVVTGGQHGSMNGCKPYRHSSDCGVPCARWQYESRYQCQESCHGNYSIPYDKDKHYGKNFYYVSESDNLTVNVERLQWEIMTRGPVSSGFIAPLDFLHYKSGVYQYVTGGVVYGHAVRLIGWGVEDDVPYWLVANSFGKDWGLNGFFKIIRGSNHLNIETESFAGMPKTT